MTGDTRLAALLGDAIRGALDNNPRIRLNPLDERKVIVDAIEHIQTAGYCLALAPRDRG